MSNNTNNAISNDGTENIDSTLNCLQLENVDNATSVGSSTSVSTITLKKDKQKDNHITMSNNTNNAISNDGSEDIDSTLNCLQLENVDNATSVGSSTSVRSENWWMHLPTPNQSKIVLETMYEKGCRCRGRNYTEDEERFMITYLLSRNKIHRGYSRIIWREMQAEGYLNHRSVESLSNHYRKVILPKIDGFGLPPHISLRFTSNEIEIQYCENEESNENQNTYISRNENKKKDVTTTSTNANDYISNDGTENLYPTINYLHPEDVDSGSISTGVSTITLNKDKQKENPVTERININKSISNDTESKRMQI